jgi:hypothetical protein
MKNCLFTKERRNNGTQSKEIKVEAFDNINWFGPMTGFWWEPGKQQFVKIIIFD